MSRREAMGEIVATAFAALSEEARSHMESADLAFARVHNMNALSCHPHLRRIEVQTPAGPVCHPAPAPIVIGQRRQYGGMLAANGGG